MIRVNDNFRKIPASYLFSTVGRKVREFKETHPDIEVIRMDIGDVTRPICPACIEAMHKAVDDLANSSSFYGYGPEQGYDFLRRAIVENDYRSRGVSIEEDEVFVSDGAKSDLGNLGDILSRESIVAIADPAYPAYIDDNAIDGRAGDFVDGRWSKIVYLDCTPENDFLPQLPTERPDIIIMCYPNNPTGVTLTKEQLKKWVDYAIANQCLIIYDSAYERFITSDDVPHSIYEIEGAEKVAIEVRSFSKTAGFTGLRCGYTVVPKALVGKYDDGSDASLNQIWNRRQCTKFNGASYVSQRAAEAVYSHEGAAQVADSIEYYLENARILREGLKECGFEVYGGVNSPYVWFRAPGGMTSWECFDFLLNNAHVTCTPGSGFGASGEGFIRLTAFNTHEKTHEAIQRIRQLEV